jgi:hypothetical protein
MATPMASQIPSISGAKLYGKLGNGWNDLIVT